MTGHGSISGVIPRLAVKAGHHPQRSETGIGALMPWADRLWFVTYVASKSPSGSRTGLFSVDDDLQLTKHPESVVGTYANRMIHGPSDQLMIGPHLIDTDGNVRTVDDLVNIRLTATAKHLRDPKDMVYCLGMEGELFELNVRTLKCRHLTDVTRELSMAQKGEAHHAQSHFKAAFTGQGRFIVANNTYEDEDHTGVHHHGRLAEWNGETWRILDHAQYNEVMGRTSIGDAIFAVGADRASAILKVRVKGTWETYRLPKGTHTQDHTVTTEWPRIREVESERWLMNASGMLYELPAMQYAGKVWGVRPVCTHLRIIGDFCSWNGLLVMAGDQTTPIWDSNAYVGQPQANLWLGKTDDLWSWGKPKGWGGPWYRDAVKADEPSAPFLMTGFENKCLHLRHREESKVAFAIQVDFHGDGVWDTLCEVSVPPCGYRAHCFEPGFSAHWVRVVADRDCAEASAQFIYT
ncbi:MAG: hypothetical protein HN742_04465 [Lentisphaerae bacterium]|jgi:hypothetical protein|nr:hypothetical protein [Lentisphaerota bacterium]MBT4816433.1 hypothetical protein [Lentisphaerota bacterium]MBT5610090.1 hypothetical protein [Lentisphaerota bacterium]MBT7061637.1 hypothetical protein [Lentisphaerota bacterium]MBT7841098.1 hypothetical protein [Lentisphaerota bacterium]